MSGGLRSIPVCPCLAVYPARKLKNMNNICIKVFAWHLYRYCSGSKRWQLFSGAADVVLSSNLDQPTFLDSKRLTLACIGFYGMAVLGPLWLSQWMSAPGQYPLGIVAMGLACNAGRFGIQLLVLSGRGKRCIWEAGFRWDNLLCSCNLAFLSGLVCALARDSLPSHPQLSVEHHELARLAPL